MQTQSLLALIDQQATQWDFSAKQAAYIESVQSDEAVAGKYLSKNWVQFYSDPYGHAAAPSNWIARTLFSRNHADVLKVRR